MFTASQYNLRVIANPITRLRICFDTMRAADVGSLTCTHSQQQSVGLRMHLRTPALPMHRCPPCTCSSSLGTSHVAHRKQRGSPGWYMTPSMHANDRRGSTALVPRIRPRCTSKPSSDADVHTEFIAETLLPTRHGKFRLRGYRHTVCNGWFSRVRDIPWRYTLIACACSDGRWGELHRAISNY